MWMDLIRSDLWRNGDDRSADDDLLLDRSGEAWILYTNTNGADNTRLISDFSHGAAQTEMCISCAG